MKNIVTLLTAVFLLPTGFAYADNIDLSGLKAKRNTFTDKNIIEQTIVRYIKAASSEDKKTALYTTREFIYNSDFDSFIKTNSIYDFRCDNFSISGEKDALVLYKKKDVTITFKLSKVKGNWKIKEIQYSKVVKIQQRDHEVKRDEK